MLGSTCTAVFLGAALVLADPGGPRYDALYRKVEDSIVDIVVFGDDHAVDGDTLDVDDPLFARGVLGVGTGFVVDESGGVVTNAHAVVEAARVFVRFGEDPLLRRAEVRGFDTRYDLAYLQAPLPGSAKPLGICKRCEQAVGTWVAIVGSPLGLGRSLTFGMVAATGRAVVSEKYDDFLQLAASVNPGNSGGPVLTLDGEVLGVVTLKATGAHVEGIAFAIPAHVLAAVYVELRERGYFRRLWLGVEIRNSLARERASGRYPSGVVVTRISEGSPAEKGGLRVGDALVALNGEAIASKQHLARLLFDKAVAELRFEAVAKSGERRLMTLPAVLEENDPEMHAAFARRLALGLSIEEVTPYLRRARGLAATLEGVFVKAIRESERGYGVGLRRGDVITGVDRRPTRTVRELLAAIYACAQRGRCELSIQRGAAAQKVTLEVEANRH